MSSRLLVDTSAWIEGFSPKGDSFIRNTLQHALDENLVATCGIIRLELLQGARDRNQYKTLFDSLSGLHYLLTPEIFWQKTARLSFYLRRRGTTIPTTDLIIATIAMQYNCILLHRDKHFNQIALQTSLKIFRK
jgi:predicted nucleic acid-binding protein